MLLEIFVSNSVLVCASTFDYIFNIIMSKSFVLSEAFLLILSATLAAGLLRSEDVRKPCLSPPPMAATNTNLQWVRLYIKRKLYLLAYINTKLSTRLLTKAKLPNILCLPTDADIYKAMMVICNTGIRIKRIPVYTNGESTYVQNICRIFLG